LEVLEVGRVLWLSSGGSRDAVKRLIYVSCTEMI